MTWPLGGIAFAWEAGDAQSQAQDWGGPPSAAAWTKWVKSVTGAHSGKAGK